MPASRRVLVINPNSNPQAAADALGAVLLA